MTSDRMMKLMAYTDGELDAAEREEVESWLAQDAEAASTAHQLANLGELVQVGYETSEQARSIAAFDVTDAIMAKVEAADRVPSLDVARARRQKNLRVGGMVAAALALAAAVFVEMRHKEEQPMARTVAPAAPVAAGGDVEVDVAETPGQSIGVYYLPDESSLTTSVVVWVDESGEK